MRSLPVAHPLPVAPSLTRAPRPPPAQVDVYGTGVLAYEACVGFTPVVAPATATAKPRAWAGDRAADLHFPALLSENVRDFVRAALAEDPADRPTAQQMLQHPWLAAALAAPGAAAAQ
jgi:serine/threonine protein kinase